MDKKLEPVMDRCTQVLKNNNIDGYTVPSRDIYPHQWLWDSCFVAIGLRHIDIGRAKKELSSLKRGAWSNGMLPNIIFHPTFLNFDHSLWDTGSHPEAPSSVKTPGITQPPMLAEAVVKVGELMPKNERIRWYKSMFDCVLDYHKWLYKERNPDGDGLIILLHPYESGLDNSPSWMYALSKMKYPWWVKVTNKNTVKVLLNHFRRDAQFVPTSQRIGLKSALECFYAARRLAKSDYKFIPGDKNQLAIQDLNFNSILIHANKQLAAMAESIDENIPSELSSSMELTEKSLEKLWSPEHNQYFSRNYLTKRLIKQSTFATFMPLYAGSINKKRANALTNLLKNPATYHPAFPVPTVSMNSPKFRREKYWQGPTWVNTNWLIVQGLKRYGFNDLAEEITQASIAMVTRSGPYEYFSPFDGAPKGVKNFSWTASLTIDFLKDKQKS